MADMDRKTFAFTIFQILCFPEPYSSKNWIRIQAFDITGLDLCSFDITGLDLCSFDITGLDLCSFYVFLSYFYTQFFIQFMIFVLLISIILNHIYLFLDSSSNAQVH